MAKDEMEPETELIVETDNFSAWKAQEPDGEVTYHVELGLVTLHFFQEEWDEFVKLAQLLAK